MQKRMWLLLVALLALAGSPAAAQQRQISGRVTGPDGGPLAGASVAIAGTTRGVRTDQEGNFTIGVPAGDARLFASRVGYVGRLLVVPAGQATANFRLENDVLQLEGVVVTGQATSVARRNLANAVATVSANDVARAPTQSVDRALAGKIVGANITANSGAPGGGIQVRLRGVSSINASAEPLWVIDGMVMSNAAIPSGQNAVTRALNSFDASNQDNATNRVADLNPADIESIEVLKGASAAAIYGSKASNGVIIVTTKRGREGAPQVNFTQRFGVSAISNTLGSRQFTRASAIAQYDPKGLGTAAFDPSLYFNADGSPKAVYDHERELAGRKPTASETEMSVSGGSGGTRYFASGLVQNDPGIIGNTGFQKQSFRVNLDQKVGGRVDLGFSTNLTHSVASRGLTNNDNSNSSFYVALSGTPSFVDLRGSPALGYPKNPFNSSNPLQTAALMRNDETVWRFTGAATAKVDLLQTESQSLRLLGTGGADYFQQKNSLFFPPILQFEPDDGLPGTVVAGDGDNLNLNGNANLVHTYTRGGMTATTSAGAQYEDRDLNILRSIGLGLPSGLDRVDAAQSKLIFPRRERVRDWGLFAQEELTLFDSRMLLTGGIRADRSSANGDPSKYFYYPKAAVSYRFAELLPHVDELKLRTAYGETGNQPLFGQQFTELSASSTISGFPALGVPIGTLAVAGAKDIHPEREREIEGGLDATLFNGRATLELTGYRKHISDLILQRAIAPSSGYVTQIKNGGDMVTKGIEAAVAATPVQSGLLTWVSRASFFRTRSTITDLPVPTFRPVGVQFTSVALGAFQIEKGKSSTQIVGNEVGADGKVHVVQLGDATPDFNMSFTNELTHGPFRAYALVDWQHGGDIINLTRLLYDAGGVSSDYDLPSGVSAPRDIPQCYPNCSGLERISGFGPYTKQYIEDASFVKLREVALTYTLPRSLTGRLWRGNGGADLTLSGRNLWTHTHYSGLDPEVSNFGSQQITRGIDVAPFPPSRSYWIAFNVRF
jgi:TonB-linked SusC/RagA family outer membrane protein